jgi:hypothetical protein
VRISRRGLETRRFVLADVELAPGEGAERVRERLREEDVEDAVVVVRITGDGEPVAPARIEEFAAERGALVARVSDRRDVETAEEAPEVSFADPDEAVRERIRELGLSEAAAAIDDAVRDDAIADANVRERVRERVEALIEEDTAALAPHDGDDDANAAEPVDAGEEGEASAPSEDAGEEADVEATDDGGDAEPDEPATGEEPVAVEASEGERSTEDEPAPGGDEPAPEDGGATTIEDFL